MDYIRDTLPREIIELIILHMTIKAKRILRSTNKYWYQFIKLDDFTIYFASPKTIPAITEHFAQAYSTRLIGLSFEKILATETKHFPIKHFIKLTHLTSLNFKFSRGAPASVINFDTLATHLTNLLRWPSSEDGGRLTNLTSLQFGSNGSVATLSLYTKLHDLRISSYHFSGNIFALVGNPSRITSLDIGIQRLEVTEDFANTLTQFKNLKTLKFYPSAQLALPRMFQYLPSLEAIWIWNSTFQDDFFLLTRLTRLGLTATLGNNSYKQLSAFHKLKSLEMTHPANNEDYCFLTALTALEDFKLTYTTGVTSTTDGLKYILSPKITRLELQSLAETFNIDSLAKLESLRVLHVFESAQERRPKNYDGLRGLTNLTRLYITTQTPGSRYFTVLNTLKSLKELHLGSSTYDDLTETSPDVLLSNLPNLENLLTSWSAAKEFYNDLSNMTQLTSLMLSVSSEVFAQNPTVLQNLTKLRKLLFYKQVQSHTWDYITKLTDLEFLEVWRVPSEEIIESFSVLTNLTQLSIRRSHQVQGVHLTKLTSLQSLSLISKQAKRLYEKNDLLIQKLTRLTYKEFRN